jgi:hypothetical protein
MKRSGWRTLLTAVVAAAALVVSGGAASAATGGGHGHGLRPEKFTIKIINGADGKVKAFGPVHGRAVDKEMSDTRAVFDFGHGNTVNVWHSAVSVQPKVDPKSCKATAYTAGQWKFLGGTGKYKHAFGFGKFKFFLFAVLKKKDGKCDTTSEPKFELVKVFAWGKATAGKHKH